MLSVTQGLAGCVVCRAVLVPCERRPRVHTSGTILRRLQSLVTGSRARELVGQVALGLDLEREGCWRGAGSIRKAGNDEATSLPKQRAQLGTYLGGKEVGDTTGRRKAYKSLGLTNY